MFTTESRYRWTTLVTRIKVNLIVPVRWKLLATFILTIFEESPKKKTLSLKTACVSENNGEKETNLMTWSYVKKFLQTQVYTSNL